ncbi:MAG: TusE/DsrC/DsvC family sulfur relay protein [Methylocystis sp.]|nr:TusE/DsrC/DsvC family sulfur relay protein [Methylocystis sp.]
MTAIRFIPQLQQKGSNMIHVNGKAIETDAEGYLADLHDWSEEVAEFLAAQDELKLDEKRWQVIRWIRDYYAENGTAPNLRVMTKLIGNDLGEEFGDKKYLFDLFPYGPAKQAARYAGMPKPTGCV